MKKETWEKITPVIRRIYSEKDYDFVFKQTERPDFVLNDSVISYAKYKNIKIEIIRNYDKNGVSVPSSQWNFMFPEAIIGKCPTAFRTYFAISKLCDVFVYSHHFVLTDLTPNTSLYCNRLEGLGCFRGEKPVIFFQEELMELLKCQMQNMGFAELRMDSNGIDFFPGIRNNKIDDFDADSYNLSQESCYDLIFNPTKYMDDDNNVIAKTKRNAKPNKDTRESTKY